MQDIVIDARGLELHRARGIGRVIGELLPALHRAGLRARVAGPPSVHGLLAASGTSGAAGATGALAHVVTQTSAFRGILTPGPFGREADARLAVGEHGLLLRLAPTAPSALDGRSVVVCYDLIPLADLDAHFPLHRRLRNPLAREAYLRSVDVYRRARCVIAISRAVADDVHARLAVPRSRLRALPLAASDAFHLDRARAPARAGARDEVVWVLGGLNANKNLDVVLATWALGSTELPRLTIVGGLPPRIVWRVRALARLRGAPAPFFAGRLDDAALATRMRGARCVIVPSRAEGFGLPVAEARATGAHVVASDLPVLREAGDDDVTYVSPADADAWRRAILAAPPGRVPTMRRRWDDVAKELVAILRDA